MSEIDEIRGLAECLVAAEQAYIAAKAVQSEHSNAPEFTAEEDVLAWLARGRDIADIVMSALCARQRAEDAARLALWELVGQTPPDRD